MKNQLKKWETEINGNVLGFNESTGQVLYGNGADLEELVREGYLTKKVYQMGHTDYFVKPEYRR